MSNMDANRHAMAPTKSEQSMCRHFARLAVVALAVAALAPLARAQSGQKTGDCRTLLRMHGFLSRAQFQCRFRYYNKGIIQAARGCIPRFSEAEGKQLLAQGMEMFDSKEKQEGHDAMCRSVLHDFPEGVRQ